MRYLTLLSLLLIGCSPEYELNSTEDEVTAPIEMGVEYVDPIQSYQQSWEQFGELSNLEVLVVLDKSGSMSDDWPRVYEGLFNLVTLIDDHTNSWTIRPITTDYYPRVGNTISSNSFWNYNTIEMAVSGMVGGGIEAGLAASYNYLDDRQSVPAADSDLLILMISDEEDQSGSINPASWAEHQKDRAEHYGYEVDLVSIVHHPGAVCIVPSTGTEYEVRPENIGDRYIEASAEMDGGTIELCDTGWPTFLNEYSFLTSLKDSAVLDYIPLHPGDILVHKNGVLFEDWEYEAPDTIHWLVVPEPGDEMIISYQYDSYNQ